MNPPGSCPRRPIVSSTWKAFENPTTSVVCASPTQIATLQLRVSQRRPLMDMPLASPSTSSGVSSITSRRCASHADGDDAAANMAASNAMFECPIQRGDVLTMGAITAMRMSVRECGRISGERARARSRSDAASVPRTVETQMMSSVARLSPRRSA